MPIIGENTTPSTNPSTKLDYKRFLPIAIIIFVIILLTVGTTLFKNNLQLPSGNNQLKVFVEGFKIGTASLNYPSAKWQDALSTSYSKALAQKDKARQFDTLSGSFNILSRMYSLNPAQDTRESLQNLKNYLKTNYKEFYKEKQFLISCIDDGCNLPMQSKEIEDIKKRITKLNSIDEKIKKLALQSFDRASSYKTEPEKWPQYDAAFQLLKSEYEKDKKNNGLRNILKDLLDYIKHNFKSDYSTIEKIEGKNNHYLLN